MQKVLKMSSFEVKKEVKMDKIRCANLGLTYGVQGVAAKMVLKRLIH